MTCRLGEDVEEAVEPAHDAGLAEAAGAVFDAQVEAHQLGGARGGFQGAEIEALVSARERAMEV